MPFHFPNNIKLLSVLLLLFLSFFGTNTQGATRADELKASIDARSGDIASLEKEIAELGSKLSKTAAEKTNLAGIVSELDTTRKKLGSEISLTENKISLANLTLEQLSGEIGSHEEAIGRAHTSLIALIKELSLRPRTGPLELILGNTDLGEGLAQAEAMQSIQAALLEKVGEVREIKGELEENKSAKEAERMKLKSLQEKLADQKKLADIQRDAQNKLLTQTKNQESAYKKLIAEKQAKKAAFERELSDFQSALSIVLNSSLLPGKNALSWPLASVRLTQDFGETSFSRSGAYSGKGHNGIDLAASIGTSLFASRLGTVIGTGDTDTVCPSASYGKWVLIRHDNGLSTLYAHLSLIKVSEGQAVGTGDLIGYTGNTGYSTGPHLHFTVFATQAVSINSLKSKVPGCGTYRLPVSALNGYLDPLDYLPGI